ncbi:hypothetical protein ACROYT_G019013 [Oculina patagonica]
MVSERVAKSMPNQAIWLSVAEFSTQDFCRLNCVCSTTDVNYNNNGEYKSPEMSWTVLDLYQEWRRFSRQAKCIFEGPFHDKDDSVKVSYLKLCVGDKELDVFEGFTFAKHEDATQLTVVVKKFEEYCVPRKKHVMAVLKFSERRQGDNESFESFVTDLKILVKDCGYQEEERMVRDAIVFHCKHPKVREKCLDLADELTCEKAIEIRKCTSLKCKPLPRLKKTNTVLNSFSKHKLKTCGEVVLNTRYKDRGEDVKLFIVDPEVELVLSGNTCVKLGLLKRVYQLKTPKPPEKRVELDDYPKLFKGLGCLPGTYHIQLADGATPVLHAPRKVPVPQREKVIERYDKLLCDKKNQMNGSTRLS